jgi:tetratricopeptide (TPR) repeat protein
MLNGYNINTHTHTHTLTLEQLNDSYQLELVHCLLSIGSCYRAQRNYEEALNIKRCFLAENHVYIVATLNSISLVYLMTKDIEKAFTFTFSSLDRYRACLSQDHPDIADVLHNITECYQWALAMKEIFLPPDHPPIAATLNNISTVVSSKREKVKALELCSKALSMRERVLPVDHPDVAISLSSVGLRYEVMGENRHALEHFEKALEIRT